MPEICYAKIEKFRKLFLSTNLYQNCLIFLSIDMRLQELGKNVYH